MREGCRFSLVSAIRVASVLMILLVPTRLAFSADHYVSPHGRATGVGTAADPWDLATALAQPPALQPGDTLFLRAGTYRGKFKSLLRGAPGKLIEVRSAPREWAVIEGYVPQGSEALTWSREAPPPALAGDTLVIAGSYTAFTDLEVVHNYPRRVVEGDKLSEAELSSRGAGVVVAGNGNKLINAVVHDGLDCVRVETDAIESEIYGNLLYNCGGVGSDGARGSLLRSLSKHAPRISENLATNSFGVGMEIRGAGAQLRGNVISNSGAPTYRFEKKREANLSLVSEGSGAAPLRVSETFLYHPRAVLGPNLSLESATPTGVAVVSENYIFGGTVPALVRPWADLEFAGNTLFTAYVDMSSLVQVYPFAAGARYYWHNNSYYDETSAERCFGQERRAPFVYAESPSDCAKRLDFPAWKEMPVSDSHSLYQFGSPPSRVEVRPNLYVPGRAHIIVYNWPQEPFVKVNLSTSGLREGEYFEIRTATSYFGAPVVRGTYSSLKSTIRLPMMSGASTTVALPAGYDFTPGTTCAEFGAFVLLKQARE